MKRSLLLATIVIAGFAACKKEETPEPTPQIPVDTYASQKQQVKETYASMAFAVYDDAYQATVVLQTAMCSLVSFRNRISLFDSSFASGKITRMLSSWSIPER